MSRFSKLYPLLFLPIALLTVVVESQEPGAPTVPRDAQAVALVAQAVQAMGGAAAC